MSASPGAIQNARFSAKVKWNTVLPIVDDLNLYLPLNYSAVEDLSMANGKYTPNDDYIYILNGIQPIKSPNFAIIICDGQINVHIQRAQSGGTINNLPVMRFGFLSWKQHLTDYVNALFIDGRLSAAVPMVQGVEVNYTIITGRAEIS